MRRMNKVYDGKFRREVVGLRQQKTRYQDPVRVENIGAIMPIKNWRPVRESNPCLRRERPLS